MQCPPWLALPRLLICSNCEKAGKLKGAKNQKRILSQLESQRRSIEQQLRQRDGGGGEPPAGGKQPRQRGARRSSEGRGSQPGSPRRRKGERDFFSFNDFEERGPAVLYSDEE